MTLKKGFFFKDQIEYLGHEIQPDKLGISTKPTDAIRRLQHLKYMIELKSLLGLCNIFIRFVLNVARIAVPLRRKVEKDQPLDF